MRRNLIGLSIKRLRLGCGLTQAQLVQQLQQQGLFITQDTLSRIETGHRPVWDYEVKAFAAYFHVSPHHLY